MLHLIVSCFFFILGVGVQSLVCVCGGGGGMFYVVCGSDSFA